MDKTKMNITTIMLQTWDKFDSDPPCEWHEGVVEDMEE